MKTKFFVIGFCSALILVAVSSGVYATRQYSKSFSDVKEGAWYYTPIMDLSEEGLINGYSDGTFGVGKNITREEAAKLFYLTSLRIEKLENELKLMKNEAVVEKETTENEEIIEENNEDQAEEETLVLHIATDLDGEGTLLASYAYFYENVNKFKVAYPSIYYWNNTIAGTLKDSGYLWKVDFSKNDFSGEEEIIVDFSVSIVKEELIESSSEVLIFINRDEETKYLVEGGKDILQDLQRIAVSIKNIE